MLLRAVCAIKAHIAAYCAKTELFELAADALNSNPELTIPVDVKIVHNYYERLQNSFYLEYREQTVMCGVKGEVTKAVELLRLTRESREEQATEQTQKREKVRDLK